MLSVQDGFLELWSASRMSASEKSDSAKGQYEGRKPVRASGSWAATTEAAEAQYGQGGANCQFTVCACFGRGFSRMTQLWYITRRTSRRRQPYGILSRWCAAACVEDALAS
jgi:hypothetical protein